MARMPPPATPERRPLATRETSWAKAIAAALGRGGASPNGISLAGMLAAVLAGVGLALTPHVTGPWPSVCFLAAALLAVIRLLANMFDGMVALATGRRTPAGELFNEVPDRVSDAAILIGAGYATGGHVELGYAAACAALFVAYVRAEGKVAGGNQEYGGPMAKPQRMAVVIAACVLASFVPQSGLIDETRLGIVGWALLVILVGCVYTAASRLRAVAATLKWGQA
jgi:phosphatidylglycerophosphate synthase